MFDKALGHRRHVLFEKTNLAEATFFELFDGLEVIIYNGDYLFYKREYSYVEDEEYEVEESECMFVYLFDANEMRMSVYSWNSVTEKVDWYKDFKPENSGEGWQRECDYIKLMVKKYFKVEAYTNQESHELMQEIFKEAKEKVDSGIVYSTGKNGTKFLAVPSLSYGDERDWDDLYDDD